MAVKTEQITQNYNKYELAQLVGIRALQISMGAPFAIDLSEADLAELNYNPIEIAKKELAADAIPMKVIREQKLPPTLMDE